MTKRSRYPFGMYSSVNPERQPINTYRYSIPEGSKDVTVIQVPLEQIVLTTDSLVFINGILISKSEYSIKENTLTLVSAVSENETISIIK